MSYCSEIAPAFVTCSFFFFNDTATTQIYTLSLHDALPISPFMTAGCKVLYQRFRTSTLRSTRNSTFGSDRKSTRLNSSHSSISYAVFCLKKKKKKKNTLLFNKKKKNKKKKKKQKK